MRTITRDNYEEFFLDFLEGNLSRQYILDLEQFLLCNPDLKEELKEVDVVPLNPGADQYKGKNCLKKSDYDLEFDNYCVARLEGDIVGQELEKFEKYLYSDKTLFEEANLYDNTRLFPDEEIVFPSKFVLIRNPRNRFYRILIPVAVAASVFLMLILWKPDERRLSGELAVIDLSNIESDYKPVMVTKTDALRDHDFPQTNLSTSEKLASVDKFTKGDKIEKEINSKSESYNINTIVRTQEVKSINNIVLPVVSNKVYPDELLAMNTVSVNSCSVVSVTSSDKGEGVKFNPEKSKAEFVGCRPRYTRKNIFCLARDGVSQLGQLTGVKISMERQGNSEHDRSRIAFNSAAIGFSFTLKR